MAKRTKADERWRELGRQARILQAKKTGKPLIPDKVLRKMAAIDWARDPWVRTVVLQALLRGP